MLRPLMLLLACCALAQDEIPRQNPYTSESDLARGRQLFEGQCAPCHGPAGAGGRGANLARPRLPRAPDDQALFRIIREGLDGTEMPGAFAMNDHECWQVAAYVRALGRVAEESVPGDPARGARWFRAKGNCLRCHTVAGEGGRMGPPLTGVGLRRSPGFLRAKLLDPGAALPEGFLILEAVTKSGQRVSGVRLNEDTWSVQLRDFSDNLHSFWKQDLAELRRDRKSPMPGFRNVLSDAELDDLVAYLVSLRGKP